MGASRPGSEIKTYIDGIPFYSGVWNHPLVDLLPVNGMSSITVYKSPQLHVNGNNFASINLTTKTPTEYGIHGDTRMSAGSFGTVTEQAALYGKQDAIDFMFAQGYAKSNGHRANADGELKNAIGKVGLQVDDHWRADVSFLYVDNYAKDPNSSNLTANGAPKYATQAGMLIGSLSHKYQNLSGEFKIYGNQGEAIWTNTPAYAGYGGATKNFKFDMNVFPAVYIIFGEMSSATL
jgi:iron complex outermembrane receptor protein